MLHNNGIVYIAKNNKLMKMYHLKDLQELFPEHVFDNSDHAEYLLLFSPNYCVTDLF